MFKLLLLLIAIWLLAAIFRRKPTARGIPDAPTRTGNMVSCDVCGTHVPDSESIKKDGRHYCCEAHSLQRTEK